MIDRQTYFNLKREIKLFSYNNIVRLCDEMNLEQNERDLLLDFYKDKTQTQVCMERGMCPTTYSKRMKMLFTKIYNYKNTLK